MTEALTYGALFAGYAVLNTAAMAWVKQAILAGKVGAYSDSLRAMAIGGALYIGGLGALLLLLRSADASIVLPIAIGSTVLATNILGVWSYGEQITGRKVLGTALVVGGIALTFMGGMSG